MTYNAFDRRMLLQMGLGASGAAMLTAPSRAIRTAADTFNEQPLDYKAYVKLIGSIASTDVYIWFDGLLWGVLPGHLPTPFCTFQGLARHRWTPQADGSFIQKSFDVGFFGDLDTGLPADEVVNPYTGETVRPFHYKYGGSRTVYLKEGHGFLGASEPKLKPYDLSWKRAGNQLWLTEQATGQIPSVLQPEDWPRESPGKTSYYAGETSYSTSTNSLFNPQVSQADYSLFWSSFAPWEPWLLMDGAPGFAMWRAVGVKMRSYKDVPKTMMDYVLKEQPNYFDDADPWEGVKSNFARFQRDRSAAKPR